MSDPRAELVGRGYDAVADEYLEWTTHIEGDPKLEFLSDLRARLELGARILELGCGAGEPCTRLLAERFAVTGVDISAEQLARARSNVPEAEFIQADFTSLELPPASFEAVAAFYSLNHVPRELLPELFARVHSWLVPGGLLLASLGISDTHAWTGTWLGTTMFFSSYTHETNSRLLDEAGFERLRDELVTIVEPEPDGEGAFQWVVCRT
jgi:cyclopropane fatty-acyl-phospholipid synthase-like methyltransferase